MKTSKKILLITGGAFLGLMVTSLLIFRSNLQAVLREVQLRSGYKAVPVDRFDGLDFSASWVVRVRQGTEHKVELAMDEGTGLKPRLENRDGTLYFRAEAADGQDSTGSIRAKVTAPSLELIRAERGTEIRMEGFESDSLSVVLEDGGLFSGRNNRFIYVTFETSGDARLEFTDDPE